MLYKSVFKTFKKKWAQILAIGLVIFISSFIYTVMAYAIDGLKKPTEEFFKESKLEDFSIDMYNGLTQNEIEYLLKNNPSLVSEQSGSFYLSDIKRLDENLFNEIIENRKEEFLSDYNGYELELRDYKDINYTLNGKGNKGRVFKNGITMNLTYIEEGRKAEKDDEITIDKTYAKNNNLNIGDYLDLNGEKYKIVGFSLLPDYNLPLLGTDLIIDNRTQSFIIMTDKAFDELKGDENFHFSGVSKGEWNESKFKTDVVDTYKDKSNLNFITNIVSTQNQIRSGGIYLELKGGKAMSMGLSIVISSIAILIVAILIYKILREEKGQIGVLKALGYKNKKIAKPYIVLILLMSLPMLILGYIGGWLAAEPLKNMYLMFYLLPSVPIRGNFVVALTAIIVPLIFFIGLSSILIIKMLSKKALDLLRNSEKNKVSFLNKLTNKILKNTKGKTKFKYSFIFKNTAKFLVFFFGVLFSTILIVMALMMSSVFNNLGTKYYERVGYNYEGFIDNTKELPKLSAGEEKFLQYPSALYKDEMITLIGLSEDNKLHKLYDKDNKDITKDLDDGIVMTSSFALKNGIKIGDTIKVQIGNKEDSLKIVGETDEYTGDKLYISRKELSELISDEKNPYLYNGVFSKEKLNSNDYVSVVNKNTILEQSKSMQGFVRVSIYSMIASAIFIAVIIMFVLTSLTIEDNTYSISLLKVMGYNKKEVNSMILDSYKIYTIIAYLIGLPLTIVSMNFGMKYLASEFGMILPVKLSLLQAILGFVIVLIIFYLGTFSAKRKINKISLQETLKRE